MSSTGIDTGSGSARHREHKQGNQERTATPEQVAAVVRIRRCQATAFYDILDLESVRSTCTDAQIKKAYRKQSLLTHPDKNGHEHADEAFKMVARAFSILGDKDKRERYDRFGGDPDSRFHAGSGNEAAGFSGGNPFAGFRTARPGFDNGWDDAFEEISPEELFRRFFGGDPFGPNGGAFGPAAGMGGFGGASPATNIDVGSGKPTYSYSGSSPSIFGGSHPAMLFEEADPEAGFTEQRTTPNLNIDYFMREADVKKMSKRKLYEMDKKAELTFLKLLEQGCLEEQAHKQQLANEARGWLFPDPEKMEVAVRFQTPSCKRYEQLVRSLR